jgi:hypothetical protein
VEIMTDLERFLVFYNKVGIELKPVKNNDSNNIIFRFGKDEHNDNEINTSDKFNGYNGFYSDIAFTRFGAFVRQGFWE